MKKILFITVAIIVLIGPFETQALQPLEFIAPIPGLQSSIIPNNIGEYFKNLYQFGFYLAVALAVMMITWGGVEYAVSGAVDRKADARERINSALIGILLLLGTVLILNTINPNLTNFSTFIPSVQNACNQIPANGWSKNC